MFFLVQRHFVSARMFTTSSLILKVHRRFNGSSLALFMVLIIFGCSTTSCTRISDEASSGQDVYSPVHAHRIRERKYREETSYALLETDIASFDVREEIRQSISSINQLRIIEEQATPKNVTAQIGHTIFLHCIVEPIGDRMVSWLRLRDFHLLTVGLFTYTSDDRFVLRHGTLQANDWALQIKHVSPSDAGIYECQVNTDPPRSQYYRLNVVVPLTKMVGSPDMFVRAGATLNLSCVISHSPELPAIVFWYHNERMINYDYDSSGERGSITMSKDLRSPDSVISRLVIRGTKLNDSGNYSCHFVGSSAEPAYIYVHVLQGEKRQSDQVQNDEVFELEAASSGVTFYSPFSLILVCAICHIYLPL